MAKYFADFRGHAIGDQPAGWRLADSTDSWTVASDSNASHGVTLARTGAGDASYATLVWEAPSADPDRADFEFLARVRAGGIGPSCQLIGRMSNDDRAVGDSYWADVNNGTIRSCKTVSGVFTQLLSPTDSIADVTVYFYMRYRVNGSTQKVKAWDGTLADEPTAWDVETSDTDVSAAGDFGVGNWVGNENWFDWIVLETGGGTAEFEYESADLIAPERPSIVYTDSGEGTVGTMTVAWPSTVNGGDLAMIVAWANGSSNVINTPTGFTELAAMDASAPVNWVGFKHCDGTESGNVTITATLGDDMIGTLFIVRGHALHVDPEISAQSNATSTSPNPASLTTSWSLMDSYYARNTLWLEAFIADHDSAGETIDSYSTGFTKFLEHTTSALGIVGLARYEAAVTTGAMDPDAGTLSASQEQAAWTIAIKGINTQLSDAKFPQVVTKDFQAYTASAASYNVSITGYTPGNIGIIAVVTDDAGTSVDFTTPAGWTKVDSGSPVTGSRGCRGLYWKLLGENETDPVNLALTSGSEPAHAVYIEVSGGSDVAAATTDFQTASDNLATNLAPPSLTAPWGAENNLWIVGLLGMDDPAWVTTWPYGYQENGQFDENGNPTDSNEWIALSHRNAAVETEAPSDWWLSESESICSFTMVIRGEAKQSPIIPFRKPKFDYLVDVVADSEASSVTTFAVTHGLSLVPGDVLVAAVHWNNNGTLSSNGGVFFEDFQEGNPTASSSRQTIYTRVVDGTEGATFTWDSTAAGDVGVVIAQFRGIEFQHEVVGRNLWTVAPSTTQRVFDEPVTELVLSDLTTSIPSVGLIITFGDHSGTTSTASYTDGYVEAVHNSSDQTVGIAYKVYDTPNKASGLVTFGSSNDWVCHHVALRRKKYPLQNDRQFAFDKDSRRKRVVVF